MARKSATRFMAIPRQNVGTWSSPAYRKRLGRFDVQTLSVTGYTIRLAWRPKEVYLRAAWNCGRNLIKANNQELSVIQEVVCASTAL
jgi:hypothetical protein